RSLLVRLREIGDVFFPTPAIHATRGRFPSARLTYIVEPAAAPVVAGNPHIDELIVVPRRHGIGGFVNDVALGRRLKAQAFDLAIDFHGGARAPPPARVCGARGPARRPDAGGGPGWTARRAAPPPRR